MFSIMWPFHEKCNQPLPMALRDKDYFSPKKLTSRIFMVTFHGTKIRNSVKFSLFSTDDLIWQQNFRFVNKFLKNNFCFYSISDDVKKKTPHKLHFTWLIWSSLSTSGGEISLFVPKKKHSKIRGMDFQKLTEIEAPKT